MPLPNGMVVTNPFRIACARSVNTSTPYIILEPILQAQAFTLQNLSKVLGNHMAHSLEEISSILVQHV